MPEPRTLLPHQKRAAIEICEKHGIPRDEFAWEEVYVGNSMQVPLVSKLVHGSFYFIFDAYPDGRLQDEFSPAMNDAKCTSTAFGEWPKRWQNVKRWAGYLAREIDAIDFLSSPNRATPSLPRYVLETEDDSPFSEAERVEVVDRLHALEGLILDVRDFQEEEAEFVRKQFEHLEAASATAGRRSWFQTMLGCMVSIAASLFSGDARRKVWGYVESAFQQVMEKLPDLS